MSGWYEQFRIATDAIDQCLKPDGCRNGHLSWNGESVVASASDLPATGDRRCPVRSDSCGYGSEMLRRRAAAVCAKIGQVEYATALVSPTRSKCVEMMDKSTESGKRLIVLAGPPGRGKDFALAWHFFDRRLPVSRLHWFRAPQLTADGVAGDKGYREALKITNGYVVLQDLGAERVQMYGESTAAIVLEFIDRMHGNGNTVCVSTNLSKPDLFERYGARFASRLDGFGLFGVVGEGEPDYRRAQP